MPQPQNPQWDPAPQPPTLFTLKRSRPLPPQVTPAKRHKPSEDLERTIPEDPVPAPLDKGDCYGRPKEEIFPDFMWTVPDRVCCTEVYFRPHIPKQLSAEEWSYQQALFLALIWYFQRLRWINDAGPRRELAAISWAELAIDVQLNTHLVLDAPHAESEAATLERRGKYMAAAAERCAHL